VTSRRRDPRLCRHDQDRGDCTRCRRALVVQDIAVVADELTTAIRTSTLVPTAAVPGYEPPKGAKAPAKVRHSTSDAGLLDQLEAAAGVRPTRGHHSQPVDSPQLIEAARIRGPRYGSDITSGSKPGSRPPASLHALDTLTEISTGIRQLRQTTASKAGLIGGWTRATMRHELDRLAWLAGSYWPNDTPRVNDDQAHRILRELRGHATTARVALSYLAPVVALQVRCPDCDGELHVRADATSDVWCTGRLTLEGPAVAPTAPWPIGTVPCPNRWARITWIDLLDQKAN
jgi:hypothetical protein